MITWIFIEIFVKSITNGIIFQHNFNQIIFNFSLTAVGDFWWTSVQIFAACWASIFADKIFVHSTNNSKFSPNRSKLSKFMEFFEILWCPKFDSALMRVDKLRKIIFISILFHLNKTSEDAFIYGLLVSSELKFGSLRQLCANTELIVLCQTQYCLRIYTISNRLFLKVEKNVRNRVVKIKFIKYGKIEWFT